MFDIDCSLKIKEIVAIPSSDQIKIWKKEAKYISKGLTAAKNLVGYSQNLQLVYDSSYSIQAYRDTYYTNFIEGFTILKEQSDLADSLLFEDFFVADKKRLKTETEMTAEGIFDEWKALIDKFSVIETGAHVLVQLDTRISGLIDPFTPAEMPPQEFVDLNAKIAQIAGYELSNLEKQIGEANAFLGKMISFKDLVDHEIDDTIQDLENTIKSVRPNH